MAITTSQPETESRISEITSTLHYLTLGAIIGPLLFVLTWFILGFISPGYTLFDKEIAPYSAISQPISGLGMGSTAPIMNAAFVVGGILIIGGVIGIFQIIPDLSKSTRRTYTILFGLTGLGMIIDGVFNLEAVMMHALGFGLAVLGAIAGFYLAGRKLRRIPQWDTIGKWLVIASPMTLLLTILYFATFNPEMAGENQGIAGLTQRMLVLEMYVWFVALGWLAYRRA